MKKIISYHEIEIRLKELIGNGHNNFENIMTFISDFYTPNSEILNLIDQYIKEHNTLELHLLRENFKYDDDYIPKSINENKVKEINIVECPILTVIANAPLTKMKLNLSFRVSIPGENIKAYYILTETETNYVSNKLKFNFHTPILEIENLLKNKKLKLEFNSTQKTLMFKDII